MESRGRQYTLSVLADQFGDRLRERAVCGEKKLFALSDVMKEEEEEEE
jgi:hypothetical protein